MSLFIYNKCHTLSLATKHQGHNLRRPQLYVEFEPRPVFTVDDPVNAMADRKSLGKPRPVRFEQRQRLTF